MKRNFGITSILAAATLFFAAASAQAAMLIDGFGDAQPSVVANSTTAPPPSTYPGFLTDTDLTNNSRTITTTWLSGSGNVSSVVTGGNFNYSQDVFTSGTGLVDWSFASADLSGGVNIIVKVNFADLPGASLSLTLTDANNVSATSTIAIPVTMSPGQIISVSLANFAPPVDLTQVTSASMLIDGSLVSALDVSVDFVAVPEPGALALLGLGLVGLGVGRIKIRKRAA